ncbi:MAG: hypothetical protein M3Z29_02435 [Pseudomonadota bacterium]|nr:hypothetical protein [Pseudomonadota bacterium]
MPVRIASLSRQLQKNGARLHLAIADRPNSASADQQQSEREKALREERGSLKAEQLRRRAQASAPKLKPVKVLKEAKPARPPKPPKAAKPPKEAKVSKANKPSRADKLSKKAENLESAKKADRKSAKT